MPKKTKKQKLQADRHRKPIRTEHQTFRTIQNTPVVSEDATMDVPPAQDTRSHVFTNISQESSFFKQDLTKTLMITILIICAQVGLYILQISGSIDISNLITF